MKSTENGLGLGICINCAISRSKHNISAYSPSTTSGWTCDSGITRTFEADVKVVKPKHYICCKGAFLFGFKRVFG